MKIFRENIVFTENVFRNRIRRIASEPNCGQSTRSIQHDSESSFRLKNKAKLQLFFPEWLRRENSTLRGNKNEISDFHRMKKVEFHILTDSTFFYFEWGIQEYLNIFSGFSWIFEKYSQITKIATTLFTWIHQKSSNFCWLRMTLRPIFIVEKNRLKSSFRTKFCRVLSLPTDFSLSVFFLPKTFWISISIQNSHYFSGSLESHLKLQNSSVVATIFKYIRALRWWKAIIQQMRRQKQSQKKQFVLHLCKTKYKMSPSSVRSEGGEAAAGYLSVQHIHAWSVSIVSSVD